MTPPDITPWSRVWMHVWPKIHMHGLQRTDGFCHPTNSWHGRGGVGVVCIIHVYSTTAP